MLQKYFVSIRNVMIVKGNTAFSQIKSEYSC